MDALRFLAWACTAGGVVKDVTAMKLNGIVVLLRQPGSKYKVQRAKERKDIKEDGTRTLSTSVCIL